MAELTEQYLLLGIRHVSVLRIGLQRTKLWHPENRPSPSLKRPSITSDCSLICDAVKNSARSVMLFGLGKPVRNRKFLTARKWPAWKTRAISCRGRSSVSRFFSSEPHLGDEIYSKKQLSFLSTNPPRPGQTSPLLHQTPLLPLNLPRHPRLHPP